MRGVEQRDLQRLQRRAVRSIGLLIEHARGVHVLERLRDQHVPVIVDLVQRLNAHALVVNRVDGICDHRGVAERRAAGRHLAGRCPAGATIGTSGRIVRIVDADVVGAAREGGRHVVDVATAVIVVDHRTHRHGVFDQRQVQHRSHIGIRIAVRGPAVAALDAALGDVELRLVGNVADHAGLGAGAEQRSLRALEYLDAIQIGGVDVEVAIWQLRGLVVQVDGDVRPQAGRGAALAGLGAGTQAAHENLILARPVARRGDVRQVLDVVIEGGDVQLLQRLLGQGLHRDRHVLHVLRAPLRGDGDLGQHVGARRAGVGCRLVSRGAERGTQRRSTEDDRHRI